MLFGFSVSRFPTQNTLSFLSRSFQTEHSIFHFKCNDIDVQDINILTLILKGNNPVILQLKRNIVNNNFWQKLCFVVGTSQF